VKINGSKVKLGTGLRARWAVWPRRTRGVVLGSLGLVLAPLLPAAGVLGYVYLNNNDLPDLESFIRFQLPTTGLVLDSEGEVLIEVAREYRRRIEYDDLPPILRQAILAAEDRDFFSHGGVAYGSFPRVVHKSVVSSLASWQVGEEPFRFQFPQGGSTITQQLVRGFFLQDRVRDEDGDALLGGGVGAWGFSKLLGVPTTNKLLRKLEEVRLSLWLEREMERRYGSRQAAKEEILSRYASLIYMGNGRYGVAAASEYYFGRSLSSYTARDAGNAALLAGIGKSPHFYSPAPGKPAPLRRRNEILQLMADNGYIFADLAARAAAEPIRVAQRSPTKTEAPGAIDVILSELRLHGGGEFGVEDLFQGRIAVESTVDRRIQIIVNEALETGLALYEARHPDAKGLIQGSVVVLGNGDAAILALSGGRRVFRGVQSSYSDFNRATESIRQPGSAWKPIVYLAGFRSGLGLDSTVCDAPTPVRDGPDMKWISNYDGEYRGAMAARQALAESRNTVAVHVAREVGLNQVRQVARELGVTSPIASVISSALGASEVRLVELAGAYRAMASGVRAVPHAINRVTDSSGGVVYRAAGPSGRLRAAGLSEIREGLRGVVRIRGGTAGALSRGDFPIPVMGKTGTTNDFRDALFVGSTYGTVGITVAVRIGFDDNRSLGSRETGGKVALPIFREIMLRTYAAGLVGPVPAFPTEIEAAIDGYRARELEAAPLPQRVSLTFALGRDPFAASLPSRSCAAPWVADSRWR
jgi:penicillin-binding protein 1A